jgi:putative CocE/NonD family hydrolase
MRLLRILLLSTVCLLVGRTLHAGESAQPWARRIQGDLHTRDGVALRYSVLLPGRSGRFPVIVNYSGYDPGAIGGLAYREGDTAMSTAVDRALLARGYAVLGVNARGTGCSTGAFDFLGPEYGEDGADIVAFAAAQPWSDGRIGMANWSWAGMSQLMTATLRPPALRAIAPGMVVGDMRRDSWAPGGVPSPGFVTGWRGYLASRWAAVRRSAEAEGDRECLARLERNVEGERGNPVTQLLFRHPLRDAVSDARAPGRDAQRIEVPVLSMESFQDEAVTSRGDYFQQHIDPRRLWLLQTNGGHDLYASQAFMPLLLDFFDRFVRGLDNGFERRPRTLVWMETTTTGGDYTSRQEQAAPSWIIPLPALRDIAVQPVELRLAEQGRAVPLPTSAAQVAPGVKAAPTPGIPPRPGFDYPVPGPAIHLASDPEEWGPPDPAWRTGSLHFTTDALAQELLAYGPASADLWVSVSGADADLQLTLSEVRPDGAEVFVQRGWLRLSNRLLDAAQSTPLLPVPVDRPDAIVPLQPGEPVLARVELPKFAHPFRKGSKIRLWIESPSPWGEYAFSPYALPARIELWQDADHPSLLRLGTLQGIGIPPLRPACGRVLGQPCRRDPLGAAP